jgi:hypothetical protein
MNAPIRISPAVHLIADQQFLAQLRTATRRQLYAMRTVFARLGESAEWKRAAVERAIARAEGEQLPHAFGWATREEWWLES